MLPGEIRQSLRPLFHPFARFGFQNVHVCAQRQSRMQTERQVHMILHAPHPIHMAAVRLGNRGHHGEKFRTENGRKQVPAVLGAKNQMVDVFGEGLGHHDQLYSDFG